MPTPTVAVDLARHPDHAEACRIAAIRMVGDTHAIVARRDWHAIQHGGDIAKVTDRPAPQPQPPALNWSTRGPELWAELHARPYAPHTLDGDAERAWMGWFTKRIPCGTCRRHWKQLLATTPPDYSSREAYHRWTVDAHNRVNRRLGKAIWALSTGRR